VGGKILTIDGENKKGHQSVTTTVCANKQKRHLKNTERRRLGCNHNIGITTAREIKPVNGAPNLPLSPHMFL
jgi:hypothetical protein